MAFRLTPRYEDLIVEPIEELEDLLHNIPTVAIFSTVSAMNARIDSKINEEENIYMNIRKLTQFYILNIEALGF